MTYDEIAGAWGLKAESARQLVRRKGWRRLPGNDGRTRIEVPTDEVSSANEIVRENEINPPTPEAAPPSESPLEGVLADAALTALNRHIERIETEVVDLKGVNAGLAAERDRAREAIADLRVQVAEAQARMTAAETRIVDVTADRDRWVGAASAPRGLRAWISALHSQRSAV